jgi:hypothetical protein
MIKIQFKTIADFIYRPGKTACLADGFSSLITFNGPVKNSTTFTV